MCSCVAAKLFTIITLHKCAPEKTYNALLFTRTILDDVMSQCEFTTKFQFVEITLLQTRFPHLSSLAWKSPRLLADVPGHCRTDFAQEPEISGTLLSQLEHSP